MRADNGSETIRKTEVFRNGNWVEVEFQRVHKGEKIRMYEPDGTLVNRLKEILVTSEPYMTDFGVYGVNVDIDR